jgi:hypothetical protein
LASTKSANRHIERKELQEALAIAEKGVQIGVVDPVPVIRDWLKTFKDIDIDEWMNGPVAKVVQRLTKPPGKGAEPDPFPQLVKQMMEQDPATLLNTVNNLMGGGNRPGRPGPGQPQGAPPNAMERPPGNQ